MNVGSIGGRSLHSNTPSAAIQHTAAAPDVKKVSKENAGNSGNGGANNVQAAPPPPTVNLKGQKIGQTVSVLA